MITIGLGLLVLFLFVINGTLSRIADAIEAQNRFYRINEPDAAEPAEEEAER